ncbi:MAG: sugar-binding domain-containing protein [Clostridia bacterium]|nr:sugar-binding domain-containing protein [Clostridia bacterium]
MDTSILDTLSQIAPDLMEQMEIRALVLERVGALGPIGRRALAARLHLTEREVRAAADALRDAGCLTHSAAGMELTEHGQNLVEAGRAVSRGRRTLKNLEQTLERKLGVRRVCVVRGDADLDEGVMREAAREAAGQLRFLLGGAHVIAVTGGRTVAMTAQEVETAAPMEITVVPAQGGLGGVVRTQANTVAELLAERLGGAYRLLHVPDGLPLGAADELSRLPQVREVLELLRHADVLLYGIARAEDLQRRRGMSRGECEALLKAGAVAEALGFYFDAQGRVVSGGQSLALCPEELGVRSRAAAVAVGGRKAEAIVAVCAHHPHQLLVTDEGAASRIARLLRL